MSQAREQLRTVLTDAGKLARARSVTQVSEKAALDYVTNVDHELDRWLTEALPSVVPDAAVHSEERPMTGAGAKSWLIDPLDGTHNLKAGISFCAISAALFVEDEVVLAGVCEIGSGDIYLAERGAGSWLNDERLHASATHSGLIAVSSGAMDSLIRHPQAYARLRAVGKLRNLGAQALHLCYVARGRFALAVSQEARLWDDAAGRLIAEEAGSRYVAFGGARLTPEDIKRPGKSVCGHPDIFDMAAETFGEIWKTKD